MKKKGAVTGMDNTETSAGIIERRAESKWDASVTRSSITYYNIDKADYRSVFTEWRR